ncbi:MAG: LacI family DNA-binding transcriptional regulator [Edaphobacter sp.]
MNIKSVARRAGVSTATVSRTINGSDKVTPKTAERVRRAVEALHFYPDTNARSLGSGRSGLYGLIISDITNPFFPELVKSFEDIAVEHGQEVLVANTNYDPARMESCVTRMMQRKVDGVAIMTSEMEDRLIKVFSHRNVPLVFMDVGAPGPGVSRVRVDHAAGVAMAMDHLIGLGHRRIAFISGPLDLFSARTRFEAFIESLKRNGLRRVPSLIRHANHRADGGHEAMLQILNSGARPTAVVASNDLTAIGAMGAIHEHGLRIPEDISIVGYDDIQLSAYTQPALTTLRLPRIEIATAAFRALYNSLQPGAKKPHDGANYDIQPTLILRKSTGPARG